MSETDIDSNHVKGKEPENDREEGNAGGGAIDVRGGGSGGSVGRQLYIGDERLVQREFLECPRTLIGKARREHERPCGGVSQAELGYLFRRHPDAVQFRDADHSALRRRDERRVQQRLPEAASGHGGVPRPGAAQRDGGDAPCRAAEGEPSPQADPRKKVAQAPLGQRDVDAGEPAMKGTIKV